MAYDVEAMGEFAVLTGSSALFWNSFFLTPDWLIAPATRTLRPLPPPLATVIALKDPDAAESALLLKGLMLFALAADKIRVIPAKLHRGNKDRLEQLNIEKHKANFVNATMKKCSTLRLWLQR